MFIRQPRLPALAAFLAICLGVVAAGPTGVTEAIDYYLSDLRFHAEDRKPTGDVVLVDIDARSLAEIGVWPWPRNLHGELVSAATALGAAQIAFDIDFSASSSPNQDAAFAEALSSSSAEVFLAAFVQESAENSGRLLTSMPMATLLSHSWPAAVNVPVDTDGAVREFPFSVIAGDEVLASMPAILANRVQPGGLFGIDYSIDAADLPRVSYVDILNNRASRAVVSGKTLIVGATALELRDVFTAPVHGIVSGSTIIALATETLLQGRQLHSVAPPALLLIGVAVLAMFGFVIVRSWRIIFVLAGAAAALEIVALYLQLHDNVELATGSVHVLLGGFVVWGLTREFDLRQFLLWAAQTESGNSENILDRVVEDGFDGVVIVDDQDQITRINRLALDLLEIPQAARVGDLPAAVAQDVLANRRLFLAHGSVPREPRRLELTRRGDVRRILEYTAVPFWLKKISSDAPKTACEAAAVCLTLRDVTESHIAHERMRHMALHDALTGLYNRRALEQHLDEALRPGHNRITLVSFDLDRFKGVNDALGHAIGDKVLIEVARRAKNVFGARAMLARVGGDEFSALLVEETAAKSQILAEALVRTIAEPFFIQDHRISLGASIGLANATSEAVASTLLRQADLALYRAKHTGEQIALFDPSMEKDRLARLELERDLETAFETDQFELVYQPQVSLASGGIVGAEALLRWRHPSKGLISPAVFIEVAEEMGLIHRLGNWALIKACCAAARWPVPIRLAVNVSSLQFETGDLVSAVTDALRASELPAQRLELELTESAFAQESERLRKTFEELLALGISFALDDFGTGYSSLGYLHRFPISKIKIDRSFVAGLPKDGHGLAILTSIQALAAGLGVHTIAEGIETAEQAEVLTILGCDYGQGYLYSKPVDNNSLCWLLEPGRAAVALAS